jgi:hypothetical protein
MSQFEHTLKMYAENGLRTMDGWISVGREVNEGLPPRAETMLRGSSVNLFSRDQTRLRPSTRLARA